MLALSHLLSATTVKAFDVTHANKHTFGDFGADPLPLGLIKESVVECGYWVHCALRIANGLAMTVGKELSQFIVFCKVFQHDIKAVH